MSASSCRVHWKSRTRRMFFSGSTFSRLPDWSDNYNLNRYSFWTLLQVTPSHLNTTWFTNKSKIITWTTTILFVNNTQRKHLRQESHRVLENKKDLSGLRVSMLQSNCWPNYSQIGTSLVKALERAFASAGSRPEETHWLAQYYLHTIPGTIKIGFSHP